MNTDVRKRFVDTAMALGATQAQADLLAMCADGLSHKRICLATGLNCPSSILTRAYVALGAEHRGHAIAKVFENMLEVPPMHD